MILPLVQSSFEILVINFAQNDLQKVKSFNSNFAICFCFIGVLFYLFYFFFWVVFLRRVLPLNNPPLSIEGFSGVTPQVPHSQRQPSVVPLAQISLGLFASAAPGPYCPNGTWWIKESNPHNSHLA